MATPGWSATGRAHDLQILDHVTFTGRVPYEQCPCTWAWPTSPSPPSAPLSEANGKLLNYMAMGLPTWPTRRGLA